MKRQQNLDLSIDFLLSSIDRETKGSSAFFSRLLYPLNGWSPPYPETTGYIIATLLELAQQTQYKHLAEPTLAMADWIVSLQDTDGGLPGGLYQKNKTSNKSNFNTAQMIIGLVAAYEFTKDDKYHKASHKAGQWLADNQNPDGTWTKFHYREGFFPSYYTRVAWPMLLSAKLGADTQVQEAAIRTFDHIQAKKLKNTFIKDMGFEPNTYVFLHTISYTIRGFLEAASLTERQDYWDTAYNLAYKLLRKYEIKKRLAGAYFEDFKEVNWYRCLTGEAQLAIIWLKIFEKTNDPRFLNASSKLIDTICATQATRNGLLQKKGGIKGSHPYHGRYIAFRQPNWATKFFVDALLLEEQAYQRIEKMMTV